MLPRSAVRARADAVSIEHPLSHFPRHPLCDICSCAKLFSKRVKSHRGQDPDADMPEPSKFGEQIAIDHMVVSKSSGGRVFCFAVGSSLQIHSLRKVQTLYTHVLDALLACVSKIQTLFAEVMQHPSSSRLC